MKLSTTKLSRSKKGTVIGILVALAFMGAWVAYAMYESSVTPEERSAFLGEEQTELISADEELLTLMPFVKQAGEHAFSLSVTQLAETGGWNEEAPCGMFEGRTLWTSPRNEPTQCFPAIADIQKSLVLLFNSYLNKYLSQDETIPKDNYALTFSEGVPTRNSLQVTAKANAPIEKQVYKKDKRKPFAVLGMTPSFYFTALYDFIDYNTLQSQMLTALANVNFCREGLETFTNCLENELIRMNEDPYLLSEGLSFFIGACGETAEEKKEGESEKEITNNEFSASETLFVDEKNSMASFCVRKNQKFLKETSEGIVREPLEYHFALAFPPVPFHELSPENLVPPEYD